MTLSFFITVIPDHDKPQPPGCLLGALAGAGAAQGGLNRLVDYYTAIAEQQWPIVEISPGRAITFVVQTGTTIPTNLTSR